MPRDVAWQGKTVHTGIWKTPVNGPQTVRRLNIDGDGQGDKSGHGGENRAVLVYQLDSYRYWAQYLGRDDLEYGNFGENLTVDGMADTEVCVGDRYRIGTAEFEVTQPRVTCFRVGIRLDRPDMASLLVGHHRPGFYMRVITEGVIKAGDEIVKTAAGPHQISVTDIDALLYLPDRNIDLMRTALDISALSPGWQGSFRELVDAAEAGTRTAGPSVGQDPAWPGFKALEVVGVSPESATVTSINLASPTGARLPRPRAGQYLTLQVPLSATTRAVRSYSLSSAPGSDSYRISVKREDHGKVSRWLHANLRVGDTLDVAAPRGDFTLTPSDTPVVLVSAGVGATPVLAMLHDLAATHSSRAVWWFHAARRPADHAFAREVRQLIDALPDAHLTVRYSAASTAELAQTGVSPGHLDAAAFAGLPADADAFLCGPDAFMNDMTVALTAAGIDPVHVYTERFGARPPINPGVVGAVRVSPHPPAGAPGTGPLVTFARSGLSLPFDDAYPNILDLADACDVPTRWSCRTGVCHTCTTPLLAGTIAYAPEPLEPPAAGSALLCCARPTTDVVIDI
jgi:ferredoxin-NADP reductase/MOSC domain-containing protein YiiM/ferredoxin